jgi:hypothetical protein
MPHKIISTKSAPINITDAQSYTQHCLKIVFKKPFSTCFGVYDNHCNCNCNLFTFHKFNVEYGTSQVQYRITNKPDW